MYDETPPQEASQSAKFCSMKVTQDVRKLAEKGEPPMAAK